MATVVGVNFGKRDGRYAGFKALSRGMFCGEMLEEVVVGSVVVLGDEPVQRIKRSDVIVVGDGDVESVGWSSMVHSCDC